LFSSKDNFYPSKNKKRAVPITIVAIKNEREEKNRSL